VVGLVILYLIYRNRINSRTFSSEQRIFDQILCVTTLTLIFDAVMWEINRQTFQGARPLNEVYSSLYFLAQPTVCFLWAEYCDYRINQDAVGLRRRRRFYAIPMVVCFTMVIANHWSGDVFSIDSSNCYHRGDWLWLYSLASSLLMVHSTLTSLRHSRRCLPSERSVFRQLAMFVLPPCVGALLQTLFYGLTIIWICAVLSILMIFLNDQELRISTDPLTGLNNRQRLSRYLERSIVEDGGEGLCAVMIDVDHFKAINDTYGHAVGDEALRKTAELLRRACPPRNTFIARYGGDEFIILCRTDGQAEVQTVLATIRAAVADFNQAGAAAFTLSLSMGCSEYRTDSAQLLADADRDMYREKLRKASRKKYV